MNKLNDDTAGAVVLAVMFVAVPLFYGGATVWAWVVGWLR